MTGLAADEVATLSRSAAAEDTARRLEADVLDLMRRRDWFRLLAPESCGGGEVPLPDAVRLFEEIAAANAGAGWVVSLCAGAGWFGGFLQPEAAREVLGTANVCLAGSGAPTGIAERCGQGYRISGRWKYATGADIASHFTFNARLEENGRPVLDDGGKPVIRSFVVPTRAVTVLPDWHAVGLRATATHSFDIEDLEVPDRWAFDIDPAAATAAGPLYRFPFLPLALASFAGNILGTTNYFLTLAKDIIDNREHPLDNRILGEIPEIRAMIANISTGLSEARRDFYEQLNNLWRLVCDGKPETVDSAGFQNTVTAVIACCRKSVGSLYPYCGLRATDINTDINRVWRDFYTATQHALLLPQFDA